MSTAQSKLELKIDLRTAYSGRFKLDFKGFYTTSPLDSVACSQEAQRLQSKNYTILTKAVYLEGKYVGMALYSNEEAKK